MVGTFDCHQVSGVGTFEFHTIKDAILDWKLEKDLVTSRLTIALPGGLVTKDGGHCSAKDLWVFIYAHLQDGCGERDVVSILILSTLIQMTGPSFTLLF